MASSGALRSLLAFFQIEVDDSQLKKADKALEAFTGRLKTIARTAAVAFVVHGIADFIRDQIEAAVQLKITAARLGTTTDELQAMQLAARETGVPVDALANGLRFLNRHLGEVAIGKGKAAAAEFQRLGIHVKDTAGKAKPASEVMAELSDKIAAMPTVMEQTNTAMTLLGRGGSQLLPIMQQGGKVFRDAAKDVEALGGGMSKDYVAAANEARVAGVRLDFSLTSLNSTIMAELLPGVKSTYEWLIKAALGVNKFIKETTTMSSTILGLKAVLGGLAAWWALANIPIVAGAAAMLALYLIFDDIYALFTGHRSIIGQALDKLFGKGTSTRVVEALKRAWHAVGDTVERAGSIFGFLKGKIDPVLAIFGVMIGLFSGAIIWLTAFTIASAAAAAPWLALAAAITAVTWSLSKWKEVSDEISGAEGQRKLAKETRDAADAYAKAHPLGSGPKGHYVSKEEKIQRAKTPAAMLAWLTAPATRPKGGGGGAPHQTNNINVKVDAAGAKDPNAVGKAVTHSMSTETDRINARALTLFYGKP